MVLVLVQLGLPLLLLAMIALMRSSRAVKVAQFLAAAFAILAVHLAGLWMIPPWWTPWLLWLLWALAVVVGWQRTTWNWGNRFRFFAALALFGALAVGFGWVALTAIAGRTPPQGEVVDLALPFPTGDYLVVSGGNRHLINAHQDTLPPRTAKQAAYRGQSYGVDIVGLNAIGRTSSGWQPRQPDRHTIFGTPVLAPCGGRVVTTLNNRPDMPVPVPDMTVLAGNHVLLQCGTVQVLLAHLRRGSVSVEVGQAVRTGQQVGEVGNSGASDAPHLHIHAQRPGRPDAPFSGGPLPIRLNGDYPVRGDRL